MRVIFIGLLLLLFSSGCETHTHDNDQDHDHSDHGHSHDVEDLSALSYTIYTDHTELFVEFKPLVVGQECRFAVHFTALGDRFEAITEGTVTLTMKGEAEVESVSAEAPEVPGIFRLKLTPYHAGLSQLVFDIKTPEYTDRIIIDSVYVYSDFHAAEADQSPETTSGDDITYVKEQAWNVEFANARVRRTPFHDVTRTTGLVMTSPGAEQTVAARTAGIVSFNNQRLMPGSNVSAGQSLFTISSEGFTDQSIPLKTQEAKIALDKAKADFARVERLLADQLTTQQEFLRVKTEMENAQAVYENLTSTYGQQGQRIAASRGGYVRSLLVSQGQYVEAGQPLAVISQTQRLTVKAELSQTAYEQTGGVISSANFRVHHDKVYTLDDLNGRLLSIGIFAQGSIYIPVWFEIDNRAGILPGSYVEVFIHSGIIENALVMPLSALMEEQGNFYCYVQTSGEGFEKRQLSLGGNDGKYVHVISGVAEGERVVTAGAYNIKLSTASGTLPAHGHEH